jgi:hypothetical protein
LAFLEKSEGLTGSPTGQTKSPKASILECFRTLSHPIGLTIDRHANNQIQITKLNNTNILFDKNI